MSDDEGDEDLESRSICEHCVGEEYLRAAIGHEGHDAECSYCGKEAKTITLGELADRVSAALEQHFRRTSSEPEGVDYLLAKDGLWERAGEPVAFVIADMAQIDDEPAEHVREILAERAYDFEAAAAGEEGAYDEEAHYDEGPVLDEALQAQWSYFQTSLQTESRMFNREAYATLESFFEGLADHHSRDGRPVLVEAGPGKDLSTLYRARVFQSGALLEKAIKRPDLELGPPPPSVAIAGRMNAQGIAVFYGATDPHVALAETRPPVGSKVLVGAFTIIRPLRLLDVAALSRVRVKGSVFDSTFLAALEKAKFFESLADRVARPVMPDDAPFDYLVTQAIAEYLAGRGEPSIDGIIYPSVQSGTERNIVLFHKAARVAELDIPPGTEIEAQTFHFDEEGGEPDYRVWEETPPKKEEATAAKSSRLSFVSFLSFPSASPDAREPSLSLDPGSLRVHRIRSVAFTADEFPVTRHRTEKRD